MSGRIRLLADTIRLWADILIAPADALIALADTIRKTVAISRLILLCFRENPWKNKKISAIWGFLRVTSITHKGRFHAESRRWR